MFKFYDLGVGKKGVVTTKYPEEPSEAPEGMLGAPELKVDLCDSCGRCAEVCPTQAIDIVPTMITMDLGACIFCGECARSCPKGAIVMSRRYETSSRDRSSLKEVYHVHQ